MSSFFRRAGAEILRILASAVDPAAVPGSLQLYSKDVTGVVQLFARASDGTITQLTPVTPLQIPEGGDPAAVPNTGIVYSKDVAGVTQLFFIASDGTITQITPVTPPVSAAAKGIFGDGSDGVVTIAAGTTTLTRNMYYDNLTIDVGAILDTDGYIAHVADTLTINGTYRRNGVNATLSSGAGGPSTDRPIDSSASGGNSATGNGSNGATVAFVPPGYTGTGGAGGSSGGGARTGGAGGGVTANSDGDGNIRNSITGSMMAYVANGIPGIDFVRSGAGGGGGAGSGTQVGGGGGSGAPPNLVLASAVINNGVIQGKGGNGANAVNVNSAGGGGGGGGLLVIISDSYTGAGTIDLSGGIGGTGNGTGLNGVNGNAGMLIGPMPG